MLKLSAALFGLCVVLLSACSNSGGGVQVKWESEASNVPIVEQASLTGPSPLRTTVYISINGDSTIRDAVVRLTEDDSERLLGINVGTTTPVSTEFEGDSRVWRLGDLEPGKRYGLPIGLWFTSTHAEAAPDTLTLAVEVSSPDLETPIRSNALALHLTQ